MTARNEITGDLIVTKSTSSAYADGWDRIFGKKKPEPAKVVVETLPNPATDAAPSAAELAQIKRDELTRLWWKYCEKHQKVHLLPFEDWHKEHQLGRTEPYLPADEGNTPD